MRTLLKIATLDVLLPLLVFVGIVAWLHGYLISNLDTLSVGNFDKGPADPNAHVWFYWWVNEAADKGLRLLHPDIVCAPQGIDFRVSTYPNRLDAWMAGPLLENFPLPRWFNLAVLAVPILNAYAGYVSIRALTRDRAAALLAGLIFGFNTFSYRELFVFSRVVTALIWWYPLFILPWLMMLRARLDRDAAIWAALAGVAGALAGMSYFPSAIFLSVFAFATAATRALRPHPQVPPRRPMLGGITLLVGALVFGPYLHEITIVRTGLAPGVDPLAAPVYPWDLDLWHDLLTLRPSAEDVGKSTSLDEIQADSQVLLAPWTLNRAYFRNGQLAPIIFFAALAIAALRREARGWLLGAVVAWSFTLGPFLCLPGAQTDRVFDIPAPEPVVIAGLRLQMPMRIVLELFSSVSGYIRPHRAFPLVVWCVGAALAVGLAALGEAARQRWPRAGLLVTPLLAGALGAGMIGQMVSAGAFKLDLQPWTEIPFVAQMAADPEDYAIIELPMGLGQGTGHLQTIHHKRRAEPPEAAMVQRKQDLPECYQEPLLLALWDLDTAGDDSKITPEAIQSAKDAGFRYIILYSEQYHSDRKNFGQRSPFRSIGLLKRHFGDPIFSDELTVVFAVSGADTEAPIPETTPPG